MLPEKNYNSSPVLYVQSTEETRDKENFIPSPVLVHVLSGLLLLDTFSHRYTFNKGDAVLLKRNQLVRIIQLPSAKGLFKSLSVSFDQPLLKAYAAENKLEIASLDQGETLLPLGQHPLYESYTNSLSAYQQGTHNSGLTDLKVKEALMILQHLNPAAPGLLFDFSEPEKADLEKFMDHHFKFNVSSSHFAYLTGRSLAAFKRDFMKIYQTSPQRWLQQRRLKEAYYLIKEKRMKAKDVYLEVGFADLSHFSFAFKNAYGKSPSVI